LQLALIYFTHSVFAADNPDGYLVSTHRHFSKASKRLDRLATCGRAGSLSFGYLEWVSGENLEEPPDDPIMPVVKFHPHYCRSVFCPTCWAKRVKQNNDRLEFFFRVLEERGVKRVVLFTLTPPSHGGWDTSLVDKVRSAWRRFLSLRITKEVEGYIRSRVREIAKEHFRALRQKASGRKAYATVRKHLGFVGKFLKRHRGKTVSQILGLGASVLEANTKRLEGGELDLHPHLHVVATGRIPVYVLRALWEFCGGGSVVHAQEIWGLKRLRRYLEAYLEGSEDYEGYLDIPRGIKLSRQEATDLEAMLWGVHFVNLFGVRYRKERSTKEVVGYVYRIEGFVWRYGAMLVGYVRELRCAVVSYGRHDWWFFVTGDGLFSRSPPLWEEVRKDWLVQEALTAREVVQVPEVSFGVSSGVSSVEELDEDVSFLLENF